MLFVAIKRHPYFVIAYLGLIKIQVDVIRTPLKGKEETLLSEF
jgi:hypothetical protein